MRWFLDFFMVDSWREFVWMLVLGFFMAFGLWAFIWMAWILFG